MQDLKVLAFLVRVPVGAGTWGKCNVAICKKLCISSVLSSEVQGSLILTPWLLRIRGGACLGTHLL